MPRRPFTLEEDTLQLPKGTRVVLRTDLRGADDYLHKRGSLATVEEVYYNTYHTFTSDLADVGFTGSDGITITFGEATNLGWSASASHAGWPGESCALFHGNAAALAPATVESVAECSR